MKSLFPALRLAALGLSMAGAVAAAEPARRPLIVAIAGDSIASTHPPESPAHGWGEFMAAGFNPRVRIVNHAQRGATSESFLREGLWGKTLEDRPQVVLIQFGHNDHFQNLGTETFVKNLRFFVSTARQKGAFPILLTPAELRQFQGNGRFQPTLLVYAQAVRDVAAETGTPLVDLNTSSAELFTRLGSVRAHDLGNKPGDLIHFNALGAQALAQIVLRGLTSLSTPLRKELRSAQPAAVP